MENGNILYEPTSTRADHGTLVLLASKPALIPFYFEIPIESTDGNISYSEIYAEDLVVFVFKSNQKLITPALKKEVTNTSNNVVMLDLSQNDILRIYGDKLYHMSATHYDSSGNIKNILIHDLPIRVEGVVQNVFGF